MVHHGTETQKAATRPSSATRDYTWVMIDPGTVAGAAGLYAAKGATDRVVRASEQKSDRLQATLLKEMQGSSSLKNAGEHLAAREEMKQGLYNYFLRPLFWLSHRQRKYFEENFAGDMAKKLASDDEGDLISPDPNVGIQAMDGLAYSLDSPALKDMHLELLATASNSEQQSDAHPSFASIIRQLSPQEAARIPDIFELEQFASIASLMLTRKGGEQQFLERHVPSLRDETTNEIIEEAGYAAMVDNWVRLGLAAVTYESWAPDEGVYDYVYSRPEYLRLKDWLSNSEDEEYAGAWISVRPGLIYPTDFGRQFARAVLDSRVPQRTGDDSEQ
ncbi:hypothetical protein GCM10009689_38130 [Brevibacterium antiquum]